MYKAATSVVDKVKSTAIDCLVKSGCSVAQAEIRFDNLMDKMAQAMNVAGSGSVGKSKAGKAHASVAQGNIRQLVRGKGKVNQPGVNMAAFVKPASEDELLLVKAAVVCTGVKHGLSPLTSLLMFDQQLEKYADELIKEALPFNKTKDQKMRDYLEEMRRTGLRNTEGFMGFNMQDPLSKQRVHAIINGLASVPLTAGAATIEGVKNVSNRIRKVQPGGIPKRQ